MPRDYGQRSVVTGASASTHLWRAGGESIDGDSGNLGNALDDHILCEIIDTRAETNLGEHGLVFLDAVKQRRLVISAFQHARLEVRRVQRFPTGSRGKLCRSIVRVHAKLTVRAVSRTVSFAHGHGVRDTDDRDDLWDVLIVVVVHFVFTVPALAVAVVTALAVAVVTATVVGASGHDERCCCAVSCVGKLGFASLAVSLVIYKILF